MKSRRWAAIILRAIAPHLPSGVCVDYLRNDLPLLLGLRINQKSLSDDGFLVVSMIVMSVGSVAAGVWELRRQARDMLPRKHRLEALLKELDAP